MVPAEVADLISVQLSGVGVAEVAVPAGVKVWPVPALSGGDVHAACPTCRPKDTWQLLDGRGALVAQGIVQEVSMGTFMLRLPELSPGLYHLRIAGSAAMLMVE
jgi:hypothetical protein